MITQWQWFTHCIADIVAIFNAKLYFDLDFTSLLPQAWCHSYLCQYQQMSSTYVEFGLKRTMFSKFLYRLSGLWKMSPHCIFIKKLPFIKKPKSITFNSPIVDQSLCLLFFDRQRWSRWDRRTVTLHLYMRRRKYFNLNCKSWRVQWKVKWKKKVNRIRMNTCKVQHSAAQ